MHLITAAIVSLIVNKKIGKLNLPGMKFNSVPSFRGIIEYKHGIPGRHRFRIPSLINSHENATILEDNLPIVPGVIFTECDTRTGSLTVRGSEEIDPGLVLAAAARFLDLEKEIEKPLVSKFSYTARTAWKGLDRALYDQTGGRLTADDAVGLLLLGASLIQISRTKTLGMPPAFTLIWWFFTLSKKKGNVQ